jgi:transposase
MIKRVFDDNFKKMAVKLSYSRGAVKEVAEDSRLSKWRNRASSPE